MPSYASLNLTADLDVPGVATVKKTVTFKDEQAIEVFKQLARYFERDTPEKTKRPQRSTPRIAAGEPLRSTTGDDPPRTEGIGLNQSRGIGVSAAHTVSGGDEDTQ